MIFINGQLSEASVIDSKYIKMTKLQNFHYAVPSQNPLEVATGGGCSVKINIFLKIYKILRGKRLCWSLF